MCPAATAVPARASTGSWPPSIPTSPRSCFRAASTPDNVAEAIEVARPFAVDVASGVEAEPGRKDPEKLKRFFAAVERTAAPV